MKEIICEAACSWHDLEQAKRIIRRAKVVGADAVKFQLYDKEIIKQANPKWQKHLTKVMITPKMARMLKEEAISRGIEIFFTPMKEYFIPLCEDLEVKRYKIRAKDAYNDEILLAARQTEKPVYISRNRWLFKQRNFYTVHVDERRPTKFNDIPFYPRKKGDLYMGFYSGYSCHCTKLMAPILAMHFVDYIEIHCTLNPTDKSLPDWQYSFGFTDILELVRWRDILNKANPRVSRPKFELT